MTDVITRKEAVDLCVALGFKTASKWNKDRMRLKLKDIAGMASDGGIEVEEGHPDRKRLNKLLKSMAKSGGDLDVVQGPVPEEVGLEEVEPEVVETVAEPEESDAAEETGETEPAKKVKPEKSKAEKSEAKSGEKKSSRAKVLGKYSTGPFVRWMGLNGIKFDAAKEVLTGEGCALADSSIKMELKERRPDRPASEVDPKDQRELRKRYPSAFKKAKAAS